MTFIGDVGINKTEKAILSILLVAPDDTADDLSVKVGVTKRTIERSLARLQEKGKLERIGSKKSGRWVVIK